MRNEPIRRGDELLKRCTCLWDLDQLVGEEGWDPELLQVTCVGDIVLWCKGEAVKLSLHTRYGEVDPNDIIVSIERFEKKGET